MLLIRSHCSNCSHSLLFTNVLCSPASRLATQFASDNTDAFNGTRSFDRSDRCDLSLELTSLCTVLTCGGAYCILTEPGITYNILVLAQGGARIVRSKRLLLCTSMSAPRCLTHECLADHCCMRERLQTNELSWVGCL